MALNLSRNTKVFVSSVNGVGATGGVKTCHVTTAGTGYAVGDIVTLGTTSGSGVNFKCIVASITGGGSTGPVGSVMVPNNFRGSAFAVDETATETATETQKHNQQTFKNKFRSFLYDFTKNKFP